MFAYQLLQTVKAFRLKLLLFSRQIAKQDTTHFPLLGSLGKLTASQSDKYFGLLRNLHEEFCRRFKDFDRIDKSFELLCSPSTFDVERVKTDLQLELLDLQCDPVISGDH